MVLPSITLQIPVSGGNQENPDSKTSSPSGGESGGPAPFASVLKRSQDANSAPKRDPAVRRGSSGDKSARSQTVEQHDAAASRAGADAKTAISDADRKQQDKEDDASAADSQARDRSSAQAVDPASPNPQDRTTPNAPVSASDPTVPTVPPDGNAALAGVAVQPALALPAPDVQPTVAIAPVLNAKSVSDLAMADALAATIPTAPAAIAPVLTAPAGATVAVLPVVPTIPVATAVVASILTPQIAGDLAATQAALPSGELPGISTKSMDSNAALQQPVSGVGISNTAVTDAAGLDAVKSSVPLPSLPAEKAQPESTAVQAAPTRVPAVATAVVSARVPVAAVVRAVVTDQTAAASDDAAAAQSDFAETTAATAAATARIHMDGIDRLQATHALTAPSKTAVPPVVVSSPVAPAASVTAPATPAGTRMAAPVTVATAPTTQVEPVTAEQAPSDTPVAAQNLTVDASALRGAIAVATGPKTDVPEPQPALPAERATAPRGGSTAQNLAPAIAVPASDRSETSSGQQQSASQDSGASAGQAQSAGIGSQPEKVSDVSFAAVTSVANAARNTDQATDRARIADQVIRHLDSMRLSNDRNEMTVRLHPDELGSVKLSISSHSDGVVARIVAETSQAQHAMEDAKDQLRAALEQKGMRLTSLDVSVGNGDVSDGRASQSGGFASQQDARNVRSWNRTAADATASEAISAGSGSTTPVAVDRASRLDYRA